MSPPTFNTEAELCAAFVAALPDDWTAYPETAGFDLLLVSDHGPQIGVEAKLRFNLKVLSQAVEGERWADVGPDYRAVLVPSGGDRDLCSALGLALLNVRQTYKGWRIFPGLLESTYHGWHYRNPDRRCPLPEYVPDVAAGVSGPTQLTRWKVAALEISAILEIRGYVTRQDFRNASIDHRRWTAVWLEPVPEQPGRWQWRDGIDQGFAAKHPVVYPQVRDKVAERLAAVPA